MTDARHMANLRNLADRLRHQADLIRNGSSNIAAEVQAGNLLDEANAIRWALRQINPEIECIGETFEQFAGRVKP